DILTATLKILPNNGTVTLNADGSFDYTPNPGFVGTDSFTYEVHDGFGNKDTAEVSLVVLPVPPPPAPPAPDPPPVDNGNDDENEEAEHGSELPVPTGGGAASDPPDNEPPPRARHQVEEVGPSLTVEVEAMASTLQQPSDPSFAFGSFVPDVKVPSPIRLVSSLSLTNLTIEELNTELAGAFVSALDHLHDELESEDFIHNAVIGSSVVATTGLTVGYVIWLVRGGVLLTSLLSSMPAWQLMDPLPVLALMNDDDDDDDDTLESLIAKGAQHVAQKETQEKGTDK
ncbi:MAG: Ig-like domain-containing protein, partial [Planctomycetota bacterium]|nr:Ig-like domain-containing protein [Planctomycetota bacterium]